MTAWRPLLLASAVLLAACGGAPRRESATHATARPPQDELRLLPGKPPVALVVRDGDPAPVVGLALTLDDLGGTLARPLPEASAALAGMLEARLASVATSRVVPSWSGVRVAAVALRDKDVARVAHALVEAIQRPAAPADLAAATKKLAALRRRPLEDAALSPYAACIGAPFALPERAKLGDDLSVAELETIRARVHARTRAAFSVVGSAGAARAALLELAEGDAWPEARPASATASTGPLDVTSYVAPAGPTTRVHVALRLGHPSDAPVIAAALGDPRSPVVQRLQALRTPMQLREATGTVHGTSGCVGVVVETASAATDGDVADAVGVVYTEAHALLGEDGAVANERTSYARRAGDAREAAERAAHWALAGRLSRGTDDPPSTTVVVASTARARTSPREAAGGDDPPPTTTPLAAQIEAAIARGVRPRVEVRSRVERGQGEAYVLFGSPCGLGSEGEADAGLTALFVLASSVARDATAGVRLEPWVTATGVGLLAHGPPLRGESPRAHARRLADAAGRAFAAAPLTPADVARARVERTRRVSPALARLAAALAPGSPSLVAPLGASDAGPRASDAAVLARAEALRAGPLRLVVLANEDASQVDAAAAAVDRWLPPARESPRACPADGEGPGRPRAGTYAAGPAGTRVPEAYLAFPFTATDARSRAAAEALAQALDGDGGLLRRALATTPPLAAEAEARVVGWPKAPALAIRIAADDGALDAAVLQVRALLDRARDGALTDADLARGETRRAAADLDATFDPRTRIVSLFQREAPEARAAPSADEIRTFARATLVEDAMIVVAQRPSRSDAP